MTENELDALKRRLADAKKPDGSYVLGGVRHECASCRCKGTVSVYPLGHPDKVREYTCGACQGAGYIPTDDPLLWLKAAWVAAFEYALTRPRMFECYSDYIFACAKGDLFGALRALEAALSTQGLLARPPA